ncbi:Phosphotransferase enzyme family protein [Rickettsiales endosymbiont of Paramecium tredecaurelia]|nr:aminoglycoside phosphotransferase family protein [Candidatus Sarmatiella mevalonica]MBL3284513.1 Phosphotransferase enzyme family protein [Candidatus Sarmatiella mevalonica]
MPSLDLAGKLIAEQFPEYASLTIVDVEKQGHDNRTYRLGEHMLIRMPTAADYALKVPKEQELLPQLAKRLSASIPAPIKMGKPSTYTKETSAVARKMSGELAEPILIGEHKRNPKFDDANVEVSKVGYPYPFSIYQWLPGKSINLLTLTEQEKEQLAFDLAKFLKELQAINDVEGPEPGQHNWWRGDHVSVYDKGAREQIAELAEIIDAGQALALWDNACATRWNKQPVWIHGDFAIGNILMGGGKLSAVIDFGGAAVGDPACDLVIAWTYLSGKAREIFISKMAMDPDTWLRGRAWALWKATFELCQIADKRSHEAEAQKRIIDEVANG